MPFSIATWNINSVRLRMPLVERLLNEYAPDVLCLQETKCPDDQFPSAAFRKAGYEHIAFHGQKGYHGVATVARRPLEIVEKRRFCEIDDSRHLSVRFEAGGPNARQSSKFRAWLRPCNRDRPPIMGYATLGDFIRSAEDPTKEVLCALRSWEAQCR